MAVVNFEVLPIRTKGTLCRHFVYQTLSVSFLLKNIELNLDERFLLIGEKLLDAGNPTRLEESERNLWIAQVERYEVEIQITPSRVKACSCECESFQQDGMCGHIAASLLALRRKLSERQPVAKKKKTRLRYYKKLTVTSVLENLNSEELSDFVLGYAKKHQAFSLALKARFAARVPMSDNNLKYGLVLDSAIRSSRKRGGAISLSGSKQIAQLASELLRQAGDALALEHFAECFDILKSILEKLPPVLNKCEDQGEALGAVLSETMENWRILSTSPLPPALRELLWKFFLHEIPRPVNSMHGLSELLLDLLSELANDKTKWVELLDFIQKELRKHNSPPTLRDKLMRIQLQLLHKRGMAARARAFYKAVLTDVDETLYVIQLAMQESLWRCARDLAGKALALSPTSQVQFQLQETLLQVALNEGDSPTVLKWAKQRFLTTGSMEYFGLCKKHAGDHWAACLASILVELSSDSFSGTLAAVYAAENMTEQLLALLTEKGTLRDLMRFDAYLIKAYPKQLEGLYKQFLTGYLDSHLGRVPARQVRILILHLQKIGGGTLASKLTSFIRKKYPGRNSLREELALY